MPDSDIDLSDIPGDIPDFEVDAIARCLLPKIQAYFDSPEGQAAFAEWQRQHQHNSPKEERPLS